MSIKYSFIVFIALDVCVSLVRECLGEDVFCIEGFVVVGICA